MEKHFIRKEYRIIGCSISRRQFIKLTGRAGLVSAAKGLTGGLIVCSPYVSQAGTVKIEGLPGRPYHHTADGFRNPPGSPAHKHDLTAWNKHIWREIGRDEPEVPTNHFLGHRAAEKALLETGPANRLTWLGHSAFLLRLSGWNIYFQWRAGVREQAFYKYFYCPMGISLLSPTKIDKVNPLSRAARRHVSSAPYMVWRSHH